MPAKEPSAKRPLAREIIQGLEEGIAHFRGEITLSTRSILIPGSVNVTAMRRKTGLSQSQFADRFGSKAARPRMPLSGLTCWS